MKVLLVHPSPLMYTKIYLRLEPLGLELVAQVIRQAGHHVQLIDLQVESHQEYFNILQKWKPDVVALSCNYLANVPEIIDLAKLAKERCPQSFVFLGGHSASFIAEEILKHGAGSIDCVLKGEGEAAVPELMLAIEQDRTAIMRVPGVVSPLGKGPAPRFVESLDAISPARIFYATGEGISLASWTPAPQLNLRVAVPGTVHSAAPGRFMVAAIASSALKEQWRTWVEFRSPACSSSMMWRSFRVSMA